jgi:hemerythrin-like domain-containing protein
MTILMADLLDDLHEDHRNMAVMLDLLERETGRIREGEKPDYELIHDIMRYMTVYSDAVHHPKEDLLYSGMQAEEPKLAKSLERVEPEHREIAELTGGKTAQRHRGGCLRHGCNARAIDRRYERIRSNSAQAYGVGGR